MVEGFQDLDFDLNHLYIINCVLILLDYLYGSFCASFFVRGFPYLRIRTFTKRNLNIVIV